MPSEKRKFGDRGEDIAADFLVGKGYLIRDRNYAKKFGEIDLIAQKGRITVFVEVKTRAAKHTGPFPVEMSVNWKKQRNLRKTCETYLYENKYEYGTEWRIDVITVIFNSDDTFSVNHIENAVWAENY